MRLVLDLIRVVQYIGQTHPDNDKNYGDSFFMERADNPTGKCKQEVSILSLFIHENLRQSNLKNTSSPHLKEHIVQIWVFSCSFYFTNIDTFFEKYFIDWSYFTKSVIYWSCTNLIKKNVLVIGLILFLFSINDFHFFLIKVLWRRMSLVYRPHSSRLRLMSMSVTASKTNLMLLVSVPLVKWEYTVFCTPKFVVSVSKNKRFFCLFERFWVGWLWQGFVILNTPHLICIAIVY